MHITKILIVDDRPENLLTLESLLDEPDIELVRANSGAEALAHTLDHDFALVLLDVQMPDMDGYEVAELMRGNKKTKHIPIIFITAAFKGMAQVFKGYESGAVDYLFKPLDEKVFKSKVGVFIELFRHKEALEEKTRELDRRLVELEELQQQLEEKNEQLLLLSTTDGLTGLDNRRHFDQVFADEWGRGLRNRQPLSLLFVDIDNFKAFNDNYGHSTGDLCLQRVAKTLFSNVKRGVDKVARIGGEEFAIILPNTDMPGAKLVAERVRKSISELQIPHTGSATTDHVTISLGVSSTVPTAEFNVNDLFEAADVALYKAKEAGRNMSMGYDCCRK
jgi:diguanylate cyclase (GGDEF)-like protein